MKDQGVSKRAKDIMIETICEWLDQIENLSDRQPEALSQVVDTLIDHLDSAGFAIEMKAPIGSEVRAIDIHRTAGDQDEARRGGR
jgi:hypothetical protein